MKTTTLMIAATVALAGCGGGSGSGGPAGPTGDLNPAFGGTWTGNTVVAVLGYPSTSIPGQLVVAVSGSTATITKVCPDGSGTITATGSGDNASWSGSLACPPTAFGACAAVTATLTSASGALGAGGTPLTVHGAGSVSGCGATTGATLTFTGVK